MNSVQVAQKIWSKITSERYCPTDVELAREVGQVAYDDPPFVALNAYRRLIGHVQALRAIVEFEPTTPEEMSVKNQDIEDLTIRPFTEEYILPNEPHRYHQCS